MLVRPPPAVWRCIASTPWMAPADPRPAPQAAPAEHAFTRLLRRTWRLPTWVPHLSVRHALSPLLPPPAGVPGLLQALHGRLTVVNYAPAAALPRRTRALVRGLAATSRDRAPLTPWTHAPRGTTADWPSESRAAYARVLAISWLRRRGVLDGWARGRAVSVRLYEGPSRVSVDDVAAAERTPTSSHRSTAPGGSARLHVAVAHEYRLVLVTRAASRSTRGPDAADTSDDDDVISHLTDATAVGAGGPRVARPVRWFAGTLLLSDSTVVAAMDARSRNRWAATTGRAGGRSTYWSPESWHRFLEVGRHAGHVSAQAIDMRTRHAPPLGPGAPFDASVDRGVSVPPGYALVDCSGTLAVNAIAL